MRVTCALYGIAGQVHLGSPGIGSAEKIQLIVLETNAVLLGSVAWSCAHVGAATHLWIEGAKVAAIHLAAELYEIGIRRQGGRHPSGTAVDCGWIVSDKASYLTINNRVAAMSQPPVAIVVDPFDIIPHLLSARNAGACPIGCAQGDLIVGLHEGRAFEVVASRAHVSVGRPVDE